MRFFTCTVSVTNVIFSLGLFFFSFSNIEITLSADKQLFILMMKTFIIVFVANIFKTMLFVTKIGQIRYCLEFFVLLFILNIIPMITKKEDWSANEKMIEVYQCLQLSSQTFYVMISFQIYGVYLYYKDELKSWRQKILCAPPPYENLYHHTSGQRF